MKKLLLCLCLIPQIALAGGGWDNFPPEFWEVDYYWDSELVKHAATEAKVSDVEKAKFMDCYGGNLSPDGKISFLNIFNKSCSQCASLGNDVCYNLAVNLVILHDMYKKLKIIDGPKRPKSDTENKAQSSPVSNTDDSLSKEDAVRIFAETYDMACIPDNFSRFQKLAELGVEIPKVMGTVVDCLPTGQKNTFKCSLHRVLSGDQDCLLECSKLLFVKHGTQFVIESECDGFQNLISTE